MSKQDPKAPAFEIIQKVHRRVYNVIPPAYMIIGRFAADARVRRTLNCYDSLYCRKCAAALSKGGHFRYGIQASYDDIRQTLVLARGAYESWPCACDICRQMIYHRVDSPIPLFETMVKLMDAGYWSKVAYLLWRIRTEFTNGAFLVDHLAERIALNFVER